MKWLERKNNNKDLQKERRRSSKKKRRKKKNEETEERRDRRKKRQKKKEDRRRRRGRRAQVMKVMKVASSECCERVVQFYGRRELTWLPIFSTFLFSFFSFLSFFGFLDLLRVPVAVFWTMTESDRGTQGNGVDMGGFHLCLSSSISFSGWSLLLLFTH